LLICQVQTLEQAKAAVANDADILVAQGAEGGGHGISRSTFPFVPAVVDAVPHIPVAAAELGASEQQVIQSSRQGLLLRRQQ
jgi:nitronate monooxygenase